MRTCQRDMAACRPVRLMPPPEVAAGVHLGIEPVPVDGVERIAATGGLDQQVALDLTAFKCGRVG